MVTKHDNEKNIRRNNPYIFPTGFSIGESNDILFVDILSQIGNEGDAVFSFVLDTKSAAQLQTALNKFLDKKNEK